MLLLQAVRELKAENQGLRQQMQSQVRTQAEELECVKAELKQARAVLRGIQHQLPVAATGSASRQASAVPVAKVRAGRGQ